MTEDNGFYKATHGVVMSLILTEMHFTAIETYKNQKIKPSMSQPLLSKTQ